MAAPRDLQEDRRIIHTFAAGSAATLMAEKSNASARERDRQTTQPGSSEEAAASSGPRADLPDAAADEPESTPKRGKDATDQSGTSHRRRSAQEHVSLKSIGSLERLRDRVATAAHELKRLREENQALTERLQELEARPDVEGQGTFLSLEQDPELLRRKIHGFIEAIDRYLENERKRSGS